MPGIYDDLTERTIATLPDGSPVVESYYDDTGARSAWSIEDWQGVMLDVFVEHTEGSKDMQLVIDGHSLNLTLAEYGKLREFVLADVVGQLLPIARQRGSQV